MVELEEGKEDMGGKGMCGLLAKGKRERRGRERGVVKEIRERGNQQGKKNKEGKEMDDEGRRMMKKGK